MANVDEYASHMDPSWVCCVSVPRTAHPQHQQHQRARSKGTQGHLKILSVVFFGCRDMGVSKNKATPKTPQNDRFLVGKPMVVGYHHFRKPPYCVKKVFIPRNMGRKVVTSLQWWQLMKVARRFFGEKFKHPIEVQPTIWHFGDFRGWYFTYLSEQTCSNVDFMIGFMAEW